MHESFEMCLKFLLIVQTVMRENKFVRIILLNAYIQWSYFKLLDMNKMLKCYEIFLSFI
jgi:hypothetical protein